MTDVITLLHASPAAFITIVTILGLLVGSFLNVVIHRLPIMMVREFRAEASEYFELPDSDDDEPATYNLVVPRSACPKCQHQITALENIPLISWLILRGRCRQCQTPISARYPAVELLTGVLSLAVAWHFGVTWACAGALLLTWTLVALTFIDLDKMLLPDQLVLPVLWLGLLLNVGNLYTDLTSAVIGAAAGYLSLWSLYWTFKLLTGKEGMGYGDFKLLALFGAWFGWMSLPLILLLSSVAGAAIGITMILVRGRDRNIPIPFGPYLAIAGWITLIWGEKITHFYLTQML